MKKVIKLVTALCLAAVMVLAAVACGSNSADKRETLTVYTNAGFAPYEYVDDNGNVVGVDIDVMTEIGETLGYKVVVKDVEFNTILEEVAKSKLAVGAAGMTKKAERDEVALASDVYAQSVQYVIAPVGTFEDGAKVTVDQILEKAGSKTIGVQKGTTGESLIADANAEKVTSYTNAIVASGDIGTTVAAVVIDKLPAESIASNNANLACWEIDADVEDYVIYFNKAATKLVEKVNAVLKVMKEKGVIDYYTMKHTGGIVA